MKAYIVQDVNVCEYSTVVFAETRGKARALAQRTDACEDVPFTEIGVWRAPKLDKYYRGEWEMDWFNPEDRIALCKEAGFHCADEVFDPNCKCCPATEYCDRYHDEQEESKP